MFDTEKFILEVQQRECLWNVSLKTNSDRVAKRIAWEEIGYIFNEEWESYTPEKKQEIVEDLTKKWRNVRDYYIKERKKELDTPSGSAARKKRKYNYYSLLSFLDSTKHSRPTPSNVCSQEEESIPENNEISEEEPTRGTADEHPDDVVEKMTRKLIQRITPFQNSLLTVLQTSKQDKEPEIDGNKNFLLSLLPDMAKLDERQNMGFRIGTMKLLSDIKFGTCNLETHYIMKDET